MIDFGREPPRRPTSKSPISRKPWPQITPPRPPPLPDPNHTHPPCWDNVHAPLRREQPGATPTQARRLGERERDDDDDDDD